MAKQSREDRPSLKKYEKPQLKEYGKVDKLTQGGAGTRVDGMHSTRK